MNEHVATNLIPLVMIDDGDRLRPVDPAWVEALASTMDERGLDQAIVLRPVTDETSPFKYILVAGAHRLEAARQLGWERIRAELRYVDPLRAKLIEIDENLVRHELTSLDRGIFLRERKVVWDQIYPAAAHGGDRKSKTSKIKSPTWRLDQGGRFTREAALRCRMSERTVQRAIDLASRLDPEAVRLIRGADFANNGSALAELAAHEPEDQVAFAGMIARGDARTVKQAAVLAGRAPTGETDPAEIAFRRLAAAWDRAGRDTRRRFLAHAGLSETER